MSKVRLSGICVYQLFILCVCRSESTERLYWGTFLRSTHHPGAEWSPNLEYNRNHPHQGRDIPRSEDPPRVSYCAIIHFWRSSELGQATFPSVFSRLCLCSRVSLPSESEWEGAPSFAPGGAATPAHLQPHAGPHVAAATAAGRQAPLHGVPVQSAPQQTQQPGWTAAGTDSAGTAQFVFDASVFCFSGSWRRPRGSMTCS